MAPYPSLESNRAWLRRRSRAAHPAIENFAILAPATSPLYELGAAAAGAASGAGAGTPARLLGLVGVIRLAPPEAGYVVARACRGRGVASEALGLMLRRYWAAQPAVPAVEAYIDAGNVASEKVARRAGFVPRPERAVPAGGALPNGDAVDCDVGVWVCERPAASS